MSSAAASDCTSSLPLPTASAADASRSPAAIRRAVPATATIRLDRLPARITLTRATSATVPNPPRTSACCSAFIESSLVS